MLVDYKGACHIHTDYSDGKISIPDVVNSAQDAGLDFVILSDHNTLLPKQDGWEGWHGDLLVIVGVEASPRYSGHFLALNTQPLHGNGDVDLSRYEYMSSRDCLDDAINYGSTAYIVHPMGMKKRNLMINLEGWHDWERNGFAGIEIWSYLHDWLEDIKISNFRHSCKNPNAQIKGPNPNLLSLWDRLGQQRKVAGISGLDAHIRKIPFAKKPLFTYTELFRTIRTHVLIDGEFSDSDEAIFSVCEAHKEGRCFISFDLLEDATGFTFEANTPERTYNMGEELFFSGEDIHFKVKTPSPATIRLLKDGKICMGVEGSALEFSSREKGVFRVEAYINNKPWIFSNPIYVR
ncbi:MAG: CehA/McbA family metallohydrolase [Planctomycetes bacterium]|nr:CehA/McbA family metallohydrolase [Planctomycetota bacterium]